MKPRHMSQEEHKEENEKKKRLILALQRYQYQTPLTQVTQTDWQVMMTA